VSSPHELGSFYDSGFYKNQSDASYDAAVAMLPVVLDLVEASSLVDIGCGVGTWLAAAGAHGVRQLVGVEGGWVRPELLRSPAIRLVTHDLEQPLTLTDRFDLAMSVEVAEHISAARSDSLVRELCSLSTCVLFGAAIPGQGGTNHINEQWQSYWAARFAASGYRPLDILRPRFWHRREIPVHYRQNPLLYVHESRFAEIAARSGERLPEWEIDLVHPEVHLWNYRDSLRPRTLRESLRTIADLPAAVGRSLMARSSGRTGGSAPT
jgi:SAM-dependent methyltransferase